MSEPVSNVVDVVVNIYGGGLSTPDLGIPCFLFPIEDAQKAHVLDTWTSADDAKNKYPNMPDLYEKMLAWQSISTRPMKTFPYNIASLQPPVEESKAAKTNKTIKTTKEADEPKENAPSIYDVLSMARSQGWFYRPFLAEIKDGDDYVDVDGITAAEMVVWGSAYVARTDFTFSDSAIKAGAAQDVPTELMNLARWRSTACFSSDRTLAVRTGASMSMTSYASVNGYRNSEFLKVGVAAEDLTTTELETLKAKGLYYNISAQSVASTTAGRTRNTLTHSPHKELISEVEAIDSIALGVQAEIDTFVENQDNLPQTYQGQQSLINEVRSFIERYSDNGFLGERTVPNPLNPIEDITVPGYFIATKATDIDNLTADERRSFRAAPIVLYIYPAGSILAVRITINVMY